KKRGARTEKILLPRRDGRSPSLQPLLAAACKALLCRLPDSGACPRRNKLCFGKDNRRLGTCSSLTSRSSRSSRSNGGGDRQQSRRDLRPGRPPGLEDRELRGARYR